MNEQDLRDCFAMFAMMGKIINGTPWKPEECYYLADCMVEARQPKDVGIKAVKKQRKANDET